MPSPKYLCKELFITLKRYTLKKKKKYIYIYTQVYFCHRIRYINIFKVTVAKGICYQSVMNGHLMGPKGKEHNWTSCALEPVGIKVATLVSGSNLWGRVTLRSENVISQIASECPLLVPSKRTGHIPQVWMGEGSGEADSQGRYCYHILCEFCLSAFINRLYAPWRKHLLHSSSCPALYWTLRRTK